MKAKEEVSVGLKGKFVVDRTRVLVEVAALAVILAIWFREDLLRGTLIAITGVMVIVWCAMDMKEADVGEMQYGAAKLTAAAASACKDYTIEDVQKHNQRDDNWIVIEDGVYDVSQFAAEHPGGPLPLWGIAGRDVTDHFVAFHPRGTEKRLRPLLVGKLVGHTPSGLVTDFRALRQQFVEAGLFKIDRSFFVMKFAAFMCILMAAIQCVYISGRSPNPTPWTVLGGVLLAAFFQQLAGLGHDVGHNSIVHLKRVDGYAGLIFGNLLTGISMGWWKKSHNTHHVVSNSVEYDPDIQHLPFFAVSEAYFSSVFSKYHDWALRYGGIEQFMVGNQHLLYLPIMAVARVNLYVQSILYVCGLNSHTHPVQMRLEEAVSLVGFFGWMTWLCSYSPSWGQMLLLLGVSHALAGILHVQITISHFSMETYSGVSYKDDSESWFHMQIATSMDVDCPRWLDWFHIGLQFQIEHHLFPRVPRHNLRRVRDLLKPLCAKHGLHHHDVPWLTSIAETLAHMRGVALEARKGESTLMRLKDTFLYAAFNAQG